MRTRQTWAIFVLAGALALVASGCEQVEQELARRCRVAQTDYEESLDEERTELAEPTSEGDAQSRRRTHFGLTLSDELVSQLADFAVDPVVEGALALASTVSIEGQRVSLESEGDVVDIAVEADEACDHCFRLGVQLGGAIVARFPGGSTRRATLGGSMGLVAPLVVGEGDGKSSAVKFDLGEAADLAAVSVEPSLRGISPEFADALRAPLSRLLRNRLTERLKPVTLVEFDGPSFGIEGFELTPTRLRSSEEAGAVFVGFGTNVAALNEGDVPSLPDVTGLGEREHVALSFHPGLVWRTLSLLIERGRVARRYSRGGEAASTGPFRVTLSGFRPGEENETSVDGEFDAESRDATVEAGRTDAAGAGGAGETGAPAGLDFGIHRFQAGGVCFSATARALGSIGVDNDKLQASLDDVEITSGGLAEGILSTESWSTAQFLGKTEELVQASLATDNLTVPGTTLAVGPVGVDVRSDAVVLRGRSSVGENDEE